MLHDEGDFHVPASRVSQTVPLDQARYVALLKGAVAPEKFGGKKGPKAWLASGRRCHSRSKPDIRLSRCPVSKEIPQCVKCELGRSSHSSTA